MKIKIEIMSGNGNGKSLKDLVEVAIKNKGFQSYQEFAARVAKIMQTKVHSEVSCVSRIMLGQTNRLEPARAKAYAEVLEISENTLLELGAAGNYHKKNKPIIVDDETDITQVIKKMAQRNEVNVEDLVKELLYMQHQ